MAKPPTRAAPPPPGRPPQARPDVIFDVTADEGLFVVHLKNIGSAPAYQVATVFASPFLGADARKPVSALRLFRKLAFLPPGKSFSHFVDTLSGYCARKQPLVLTATVSYRDRDGARYEERCVHDLRVYQELRTVRLSRSPSPGGPS